MIFSKNEKYDITFICRKEKDNFAQPILVELGKKYKIQYLQLKRKSDLWTKQVNGKVIWIEWANKFALQISKKKWKNKKVVVRLHRYEILTNFMKQIKWENIDLVIFVNSHFETEFKNKINCKVSTITIPNAVDVQSFPFVKSEYKYSILAYGFSFHPIKGYVSLIKMFSKLVIKNPNFRLTIMGMKSEEQQFIKHLEELKTLIAELKLNSKVNLLEKQKITSLIEDRKNISFLLSQNDIIMSYSETESFHYSFAEGLLSGLEGFYNMWQNPLIKVFWENFGSNSEDEMIQKIISWSELSNLKKLEKAKSNRKYVIENFGSEQISKKYEAIFFDHYSDKSK